MAYEITLATNMGIMVIFALSLNIIVGFCGQISLGHAAMFGIGAYTTAMLTKSGVPFAAGLLSASLMAAAVGFIVGLTSLRVRHDFLAITTMGVGFLFIGIVRQQDWLGGELGISSIPSAGLGKLGFMVLVVALAVLAAGLSVYLKRTWMGFVFDAVADDEDTAQLIGLDTARYKLAAFVMGSAIAGLAGALYAHQVRFIDPNSFGFVESVTVLAMVVVGGIGSVLGVAVAAAALAVAPLMFQFIDDYKLLVYGGLLFAMMRFAPDGVAGLVQRATMKRVQS